MVVRGIKSTILTQHEKFRIIDLNELQTNMFWEVNWDEKDEATNKCKVVKMTLPDGTTHFVSIKILMEILFACGKPEDQQKMIPQTMETIHHYKTVLGIKAKQDIHKGEMINFPVELSVPCSVLNQDVIGSVPKGAKVMDKRGGLWRH